MATRKEIRPVEKIATGIPGFDIIAEGGIPEGRATLVCGTAGSGKTIFSTQFLVAGIEHTQENGVFVTFEDTPDSIRRNMLSLGWDIPRWEAENRWAFVDATPLPEGGDSIVAGEFDLGALLARVRHAAGKVKARRVVLDSTSALLTRLHDDLRAELQHVFHELKNDGLTVVLTGERPKSYGPITRHGVEEYVADNVVVLRHVLVEERRRRTVEILKYRGTSHQNGEFPFTIKDGEGVIVIPLSAHELTQESSTTRVTSGNDVLDEMVGGGFFRDSIILVSGATGTGKTLMVTQFLAGGIGKGERCLLLAFEESRDQLNRNAANWGYDFAGLEAEGALRIVNIYPHAYTLEDHLVRIKDEIDRFKPDRLAIDSLSALERMSTDRGFREFVTNITAYTKRHEIAGFFTSTAPTLAGGTSVTEKHISTITDTIILLRYVEAGGEILRGVTVLKMRGSRHDKNIRQFDIDENGMQIGGRFAGATGILMGARRVVGDEERETGVEQF